MGKMMHKRVTIKDGSAVITGLLLAMCCPPSLPWWMSIIGSFLAIVVCKQAMGALATTSSTRLTSAVLA